ncbi:MAG TPA: FAD-linked oxidase C-terminal domain-containing protein, partial [Thermoanaerobaculia bacterium]|nr:FAD-linked oxidase C-terminal domain-containing protein [Thermoanaerobaculia bacterium]
SWSALPSVQARVEGALREGLGEIGERVHVFSHLSHLYADGSSLYTTYLFRLAGDPDENLRRWQRLKSAASQAIVEERGTISHQHGVGVDHLPYLAAEKGTLGLSALQSLCRHFDPGGLMNPGKLVP